MPLNYAQIEDPISHKKEKASWSMMYDQAFVVQSPEYRFIANFKYVIQPSAIDFIEALSTSSYEKFDSLCNETMIGTVQFLNNLKTLSCFFGKKNGDTHIQSVKERLQDEDDQVHYFTNDLQKEEQKDLAQLGSGNKLS